MQNQYPSFPAQPTSSLPHAVPRRRRRRPRGCCCLFVVAVPAGLLAFGFALWLLLGWGGRVDVLVMGLDRRPGEGNAVRADSIMVITADPAQPALGLLSVPRDLYLNIPGQGENRINTAHIFGELDHDGGGPERTVAAIESNFVLDLDGWVRVDFNGFVGLIDAVGGIEIDVPDPVIDYAYPTEDYGVMTINIPAGVQTMDGERALQYARSRHSSSDFDRAMRQQLVVGALVEKVSRPTTWLRLPALLAAVERSIETDLGWLSLVRLGVAGVRVGPAGIERLVVDQEMVTPHVTPAGAAVLLPRWDVIRPAVARLFD